MNESLLVTEISVVRGREKEKGREREEKEFPPRDGKIFVARGCEEREKEREASQERRGSPHASPRDGNNFCREKMRGERENAEEEEGEEGGE